MEKYLFDENHCKFKLNNLLYEGTYDITPKELKGDLSQYDLVMAVITVDGSIYTCVCGVSYDENKERYYFSDTLSCNYSTKILIVPIYGYVRKSNTRSLSLTVQNNGSILVDSNGNVSRSIVSFESFKLYGIC